MVPAIAGLGKEIKYAEIFIDDLKAARSLVM
jgi:hypothetical protein